MAFSESCCPDSLEYTLCYLVVYSLLWSPCCHGYEILDKRILITWQKQEKHFHSVYREETSNQRLDRIGANNSRNIVRILQPKFSRKEERERKCYLQQGEAFFHPVWAKVIKSYCEVSLHFHKRVWFYFWELVLFLLGQCNTKGPLLCTCHPRRPRGS